MRTPNQQEITIAEALKQCAATVERRGSGHWQFAVVNGSAIPATARILDGWLILDAEIERRPQSVDLWSLLRWNARLAPFNKFALTPGARAARLRAEIPLAAESDAAADLSARVADVYAGFRAALHGAHDRRVESHVAASNRDPESATRADDDESATRADAESARLASGLPPLCAEAGWAFTERAAGKLAVDLEAPGAFYQAFLEARQNSLHVSVELTRLDEYSPLSRRALGVLLLSASGVVRLVRAAIAEQEGRATARLEARFDALPCASQLHDALAALSVACRLCGEEARAVQDEWVAARYLAASGFAIE